MIYSTYGFGKFKTESAIGMTIRAIQNKDDVLFVQFLKDGTDKAVEFFNSIPSVKVLVGDVSKITLPHNVTTIDKFKAQSLYNDLWEELRSNKYKLIVADEILPAIDMGLITIPQLQGLVEDCNKLGIDLYMTGRVRDKAIRQKIAEVSDTCTDAHCIKHSFNTHCNNCKKDYKYHYTYCPVCGSELIKSRGCKEGRDY